MESYYVFSYHPTKRFTSGLMFIIIVKIQFRGGCRRIHVLLWNNPSNTQLLKIIWGMSFGSYSSYISLLFIRLVRLSLKSYSLMSAIIRGRRKTDGCVMCVDRVENETDGWDSLLSRQDIFIDLNEAKFVILLGIDFVWNMHSVWLGYQNNDWIYDETEIADNGEKCFLQNLLQTFSCGLHIRLRFFGQTFHIHRHGTQFACLDNSRK